MSKAILTTLAIGVALLLAAPAAQAGGPELFESNKCVKCHTVKAQSIDCTKPEEKKSSCDDLSKVGAKRDVAWIKGYLLKEIAIEKEKSDGTVKEAKHKSKWKGSDGDLTTIAKWLAGLK